MDFWKRTLHINLSFALLFIYLLDHKFFGIADGSLNRCDPETEISCDDNNCVQRNHVCDGAVDCVDRSDEPDSCAVIANRPCTIVEFRCRNDRCIPLQFICDGRKKNKLVARHKVNQIWYRSATGCSENGYRVMCIQKFKTDCRDSSDETIANCTNPCQQRTEFFCPANPRNSSCFPLSKQCDGVLDCVDGRDETSCGVEKAVQCTLDQFTCPDGKCLPKESLCNHFVDCSDGSDELNCGCDNSTEIQCLDKSRCIYKEWRCDGTKDCLDGSDEQDCEKSVMPVCQSDSRVCGTTNKHCIPFSKFCDDQVDCDDHSDEGDLCKRRQCASGPCVNGTCHPMPDGTFLCLCETGFQLDADNRTCKKMDRCQDSWGRCSQLCTPTEENPGYLCGCLPGYKLGADKFSCTSVGSDNRSAFLIFSSRHEIRMVDLREPDIQPILVPSLRNTIAIDFLYDAGENGKQLIFWTDVVDDKISSGTLSDTGKLLWVVLMPRNGAVFNIQTIVENSIPTAEGIAVDYIAKNLYWVESTLDQIEVTRIDGQHRATILAGNMQNPRAIVLDPEEGWLFWSDWDPDYPRIERATMAGENRSVLVNISSVNGGKWPNGLAVDVEARPHRIYWIDAYSDAIHTVTVYGTDLREVTRGGDAIQHPFAVAVFGPHVYWTDWRTNSIHKVNAGGISHAKKPLDIVVCQGLNGTICLRLGAPQSEAAALSSPRRRFSGAASFPLPILPQKALGSANKWNGSNVETVIQVSTQPFDLHIVHSLLQPRVRNPCGNKNGGCSHLCLIGLGGVARCACPHLTRFIAGSTMLCEAYRTFMLFSASTEIRGVTLEQTYHNFIPAVINVQNVTNMEIDVKMDQVYWVDSKARTVMRGFLNGSQVEAVIDSPGGPRPTDIAVDWISRNIFISFGAEYSSTAGEISVTTLSGEFRKTVLSTRIINPVSVAVNPVLGKMAWADIGQAQHRIEIASMNGESRSVLVDESSPGFRNPRSLTFGYGDRESYLYWVSKGIEKIQYCKIDPKDTSCFQVETLKPLKDVMPLALAYYENSLLFSYGKLHPSIGILNLENMSVETIRPNTSLIVSLKMFSPVIQTGSNACSTTNGNCAQLCLPTSRTSRTCNCTAGYVLNLQDQTTCLPMNSTLLYSMGSQIHGISLDPSQTDELLPPISRINLATALDFHAASSYIYWIDPKASALNRIRRDLTGRQVIIEEDLTSVENIAVDWMAGNVYWTNPVGKTIEVARLNGSSRYVVVHENIEQPKAIALHPSKGYMFWSDNAGKQARLERALLDGTSRVTMFGIVRVTDITIDYEDVKVYWCDSMSHMIERANLDFSGRQTVLANNNALMTPSAVVVFLNDLYWTSKFPQKGIIYRGNKTDTKARMVFRQELNSTVNDLIVFSKDRQKGKNLCSVNNGGCEELCFFTGLKRTCACAHGLLSVDERTCDVHTSFLLYSRGRSIESAHLTVEPNKNDPLAPIRNSSAMVNVIGLAFDYGTSRVFYSDIQKGEIFSVLFNGTDYQVVASGVGSAEGLAFDPLRDHLYWTSYNNASVFRISVKLDTHERVLTRVIQMTIGDKLRNLAIDSCREMMYWTNWNKDKPSIQRATFDGEQLEDIVSTDIKTPNAIALDHRSQYLFWADALLDKIERCRFDGRERKVLLWENVRHPFALTVYGDHIYWTDWIIRAIVRANKYTGLDVVKIREGLGRQPMGIVAVSNSSQDCRLNPCYFNNGNCSEICIPTENGTASMCRCFNNITLRADGLSCDSGPVKCASDQFKCASSGQCIAFTLTCDKRKHCEDGSDENPEYCKYRPCPAGLISCKTSKKCIPEKLRCNRRDDCGDGSDERDCVCGDNEFRCKSNGDCIKNEYRCDGEQDCGDSSDEVGCSGPTRECETMPDGRKMLPCPHSQLCYLPEWLCDGDNDCGDNSDELNCTSVATTPATCSADSFRCANGQGCIPAGWRCDGDSDCVDHSDEQNCTKKCPPNSFECSDGSCIPAVWKCDGVAECPGGADEAPELCQKTNCSETDFRCLHSGLCIPADWRCDGDADCGKNDTSDETEGCETISRCSFHEFRCKNNRCIPGEFICDGEDDCGDSSDEKRELCGTKVPLNDSTLVPPERLCSDTEFRCKNGLCVNETVVCNNSDDCGDMSDEMGCDQNDCASSPCGPNGKCVEKRIGFRCSCFAGYVVSNKSGECVDQNECDMFPCSHFCYNTVGSYRCVCSHNYTALELGKFCKANSDVAPTILYSVKHAVRNVSLKGDQKGVLVPNLTNAVALDYDWDSQCIFWSDVLPAGSTINKWCTRSNSPVVKVLHSSTVHNPDGIAVDWIGKNLYWCDKGTDTIEVSTLDGGWRKVLLKEGLQEPRALVVDPHHGHLYWSDWGQTPHIGKMGLDGSNVFRLVLDKTELGWPNAMTIDYVTNKIFWADARFDYIAMADLNLQNRRRVLENTPTKTDHLRHVFAMTVFEDHIYWTDWETKQIHKAHKFTGQNVSAIEVSAHRPMDLQIFHPFRQTALAFGPNPCAKGGGCGSLCLLKPTNSSQRPVARQCGCPDSYVLKDDQRTCRANCSQAHFVCLTTFKCIPKWWVCDGQDDCGDNSDEEVNGFNCGSNFRCTAGEFQCVNGSGCLHPTNICDGVKQCSDGSDEDGSVVDCPSYLCLASQFKCPDSHHCIARSHVCDGRPDCTYGEDEKNCSQSGSTSKCLPSQYECRNGACVTMEKVCDGVSDCKDGSDESPFVNCTLEPCGKPGTFRCSDRKCIPETRRCDGVSDCSDGADESAENCGGLPGKCDPVSFFTCNNTRCISRKWLCDDEDDCGDNSDEAVCSDANCGSSEFACDGHCIDLKFQCDGEHDCQDGSDEANCTSNCPDNQLACADGSGCFLQRWKCDGVIDCPDASDESSCDHTCGAEEHTCKNKRCITKTWLCDGDNDCGDQSDEDPELCARFPCFPDRFRCGSGICILLSQKCNGIKECPDGSDEAFCPRQNCSFRCANGRCLSEKAVCDGVNNCGDNSDEESCRLNPCVKHGRCSQRCIWDDNLGHTCVCDTGYRSTIHGKNKTCVADGANAYLLIAEQNQLRSLDPYHRRGDYRQLMELKDEKIAFIDVEMVGPNDAVVYWSSKNGHVINRQSVPKRRKERADFDRSEPVPVVSNLLDPRGIGVDWINKRLFWIDGHAKQIQTSFLNGTSPTAVIATGLSDPYDLAVDPESGYIFWTDISGNPRIERARFDGSERETLVKDDIRYPSGLAIDYANRRLYWADPKMHCVGTMTLDGKDRRSIRHAAFEREKPFSVDVFEDQLYVATYNNNSIFKMNKFGYGNVTVLAKGLRRPATVIIVQEQKQDRKLPLLCEQNPCPSNQMCIAHPPYSYKCMCPGYSTYKNETKRCENPPETFCKPPCQNGGKCTPYVSGIGHFCRCPSQFTGATCSVHKCSVHCYNNGECFFDGSVPKCRCDPPFTGDRCQSNSCANFCHNFGNCTIGADGSPRCICPLGWGGLNCEKPHDDCERYCKNSGSCYKQDGKPHCLCLKGFSGDLCETGEGKCGRCYNDGICYVDKDGLERCRCEDDFTGETCEACKNLKCENNGVCYINGGKARCNCSAGYTGQKCQKDLCQGFCKVGQCIHGVTPRCICPPGKRGDRCEIQDDCPCHNNGTCGPLMKAEGALARKCKCVNGFTGTLCEKAPNCEALKCTNGGKCAKHELYQFQCECSKEWTGSRCEMKQQCLGYCQNGGTCLPGISGLNPPTCICHSDFMGYRCETLITDIESSGYTDEGPTAAKVATISVIITLAALILVGAGCFAWRRRAREKAFQHILMEEVGDGNNHQSAITNPMYLKDEPFDDEDVLHPDKVAFANPIYESCFYGRNGKVNGDVTEKSGLLQLQEDDVDTASTSSRRPENHIKV